MKLVYAMFAVCSAFFLMGCGDGQPGLPGANGPGNSSNPLELNRVRNNLKMIGLACHNHHDVGRTLPANIRDADGKPLLSWRVALLPYLEQSPLYNQFKLDEPWDSPHNIKLLDMMPDVYRTHGSGNETSLVMVVGPGAIYEGADGLKFSDCKDGISNTILVARVGADRAVPWTKPVDVPFNPAAPAAEFGTLGPEGLMVLYGDGSVHSKQADLPADKLRALITRSGGEIIND